MRKIEYDFGSLSVGDNFIIGEMNEGTRIGLDVVFEVIRVANENFKGQKWGYISNRVHSYSLQPLVHMQAEKFEKNMVAFAIVAPRPGAARYAEFEKNFAKVNYAFSWFMELDKAISWVESVIKEKNT